MTFFVFFNFSLIQLKAAIHLCGYFSVEPASLEDLFLLSFNFSVSVFMISFSIGFIHDELKNIRYTPLNILAGD